MRGAVRTHGLHSPVYSHLEGVSGYWSRACGSKIATNGMLVVLGVHGSKGQSLLRATKGYVHL